MMMGVMFRRLGMAAVLVVCIPGAGRPLHAQARGEVACGSVDGRPARCDTGWRDAELVHQDSDTRCVRDRNWGVERGTIWVDRGCRGRFVESRGWRDGWHGDRPDRDESVQCGSVDNRYRLCPLRIDRDTRVRLVNNDSDTRCREGYNWGVNRDGIWVDRGCRGRFVVSHGW
jgi:hypothetical protein